MVFKDLRGRIEMGCDEQPKDWLERWGRPRVIGTGLDPQDGGSLAWCAMIGIKHPEDVHAPRGTGRRILFVAVPDRAKGKNKWHLDLNVGRDRIEAEVALLTALGATEQYRIDEVSGFHTTMADPEGNLFCVQ